MDSGSSHHNLVVTSNFIVENHPAAVQLCQRGADHQALLVAGGLDYPQRTVAGGKQDTLLFEPAVGESQFRQEVGSADLHPDQVVGMVDHAHPVGFGVAHGNLRFAGERQIRSP